MKEKEIREALDRAGMDWIVRHRDGTWTVKRLFFYKFGMDAKKKRQEIVDRLDKGEVIVFGDGNWRFRYEYKHEVGIYYLEKEVKK